MPTSDEVLRTKTFKGDADRTAQRIYYTLDDGDGQHKLHRTSLTVSLLIELLEKKGVISEGEIDEMLIQVIN